MQIPLPVSPDPFSPLPMNAGGDLHPARGGGVPILFGNTFPLSLVRREVVMRPVTLETMQVALATAEIHSFWGHPGTLEAVSRAVGRNVSPTVERPAVQLDAEGLPVLDGHVFRECWVMSPEYRAGFRPAVGAGVPADAIIGWQALLISWR